MNYKDMLKAYTLTLLTALATLVVHATDRAKLVQYYASLDGLKGAALKTAAFQLTRDMHTNPLSYDGLKTAYYNTDVRPDGKIWDIYSNITNYKPTTSLGNYSKEGDTYNREHGVPQSWFNEASPMRADAFHVYPTDGYVNNRRSNYPYGEVGEITYASSGEFSKLGKCITSGYSGTVFEPNDLYKGDLARSYFYMATRYEDKINGWSGGIFGQGTYPGIIRWQLDMLLRWSRMDGVSEKEVNRNDAVEREQGNRNPFIDFVHLAEYIWGDSTDVALNIRTTVCSVDGEIPGGGEVEPTDVLAFSVSSVTIAAGDAFTPPTLTNTYDGTLSFSSDNTALAQVDATTGKVTLTPGATGTATITAQVTLGGEVVATASYAIIVRSTIESDEIFYESFDNLAGKGGNDGIWSSISGNSSFGSDSPTDNTGWTATTAYVGSKCVYIGTSSKGGSITTPPISGLNGTATLSFQAGAWDSGAQIRLSITGGGTIEPTDISPEQGHFTTYTVTITDGTPNTQITFAATSSRNRVFIDEVKLLVEPAQEEGQFSINTTDPTDGTHYGTHYTDRAFIMPEGATGGIVTGVDNGRLILAWDYPAGSTVPVQTALLIKGELQTYTYVTTTTDNPAPADNLLHGTTTDATPDMEAEGTYYRLGLAEGSTGAAGFYWVEENGAAFLNAAHEAFLFVPATTGSEAARSGFPFAEEEANAITAPTTDARAAQTIYTLQGVRLNSLPKKGIYIINGKTVLVR